MRQFISVQTLPVNWVNTSFLRLLFQNALLEERDDVRALTLQTWGVALRRIMPNLQYVQQLVPVVLFRDWIETCTTPIGEPIDSARLFNLNQPDSSAELHNVDKNMLSQDLALVPIETIWKARIAAAHSLAVLANSLPLEVSKTYHRPS